ncbi:MAG: dephospho-CoA kinase [Eubacteriales bacterium]|nr:dephospho-CoA kinase [Eubacteriales bacterium]
MKQNSSLIIGLTGGSGCGKTTVANILKEIGGYIIDADKIAHNIIQKGEKAYYEIINAFGEKILTNEKNIDRKILGNIVFSEKEKLNILNSITHKYILEEIHNEINFAKKQKKYKYIVLDAPLLIETNLHKIVDTVWIVYADEKERINRLIKRDNISKEMIEKRIAIQTPFEKNKPFADFIIYNKENTDLKEIILKRLNERGNS